MILWKGTVTPTYLGFPITTLIRLENHMSAAFACQVLTDKAPVATDAVEGSSATAAWRAGDTKLGR
jgi:hypothetical protein